MPPTARPKRTTTQKGLGWAHRQASMALHRAHRDGSPCAECGEPMWLDRTRNWDYDPDGGNFSGSLHADHGEMSRAEALRRGLPIPRPTQLLHGLCNMRKGAGVMLTETSNASKGLHPRNMDWPI
jgi:hypothetical protein